MDDWSLQGNNDRGIRRCPIPGHHVNRLYQNGMSAKLLKNK